MDTAGGVKETGTPGSFRIQSRGLEMRRETWREVLSVGEPKIPAGERTASLRQGVKNVCVFHVESVNDH